MSNGGLPDFNELTTDAAKFRALAAEHGVAPRYRITSDKKVLVYNNIVRAYNAANPPGLAQEIPESSFAGIGVGTAGHSAPGRNFLCVTENNTDFPLEFQSCIKFDLSKLVTRISDNGHSAHESGSGSNGGGDSSSNAVRK